MRAREEKQKILAERRRLGIKRVRTLNAIGDTTPCRLCGFPLYGLDPAINPAHAGCRVKARLERFKRLLRQPPVLRPLRPKAKRHAKKHKKQFPLPVD